MYNSCRIYINNLTKDDRERKRLELLHNEVFQKVLDTKLFKKYNGLYYVPQPGGGAYSKAMAAIDNINKEYQSKVVGTAFTKPTAHEYVFVNVRNLLPAVKSEISNEGAQGSLFTQLSSVESTPSKASIGTLRKLAEWFKRAGIDSQPLQQIVINGEKIDANGIAFAMEGLIQYIEGKEATAIPEEGMHIAVAIIKQTDPVLFRQMFNAIGQYDIYDKVLADYRTSKLYQFEDGRPNIPKIKEEAIAKLLVENVIKKNEGLTEKPELLAKTQNFWQRIVEWFKSLFKKPGFNPFEKVAEDILAGEQKGTVMDLREGDVFLQTGDKQEDAYNRIVDMSKNIEKVIDPEAPDTQDQNYYRLVNENGRKVKNRVTDYVKNYYNRIFGNREIAKSDYQKAIDDYKKEKGTAGHKDMENAFHVLVDDNGYLRAESLDDSEYVSMIDPNNRSLYDQLKANLKQRLESFGPGARFLSEITIYDKKQDLAGTIDLLALQANGKVNILDWKFFDVNTDKYTDVPWYKVQAFQIQLGRYKRMLIDSYGIGEGDFGKVEAIPIQSLYERDRAADGKMTIRLKSIKIGNVDVKAETKAHLLPVPLPEQRTGNKRVDTMLTKLQAIEKSLKDKRVTNEAERIEKRELLQNLYTAIRILQVQQGIEPTIQYVKTLNKDVESFVAGYKLLKPEDLLSQTYEQLSDLAENINDKSVALSQFAAIQHALKGLYQKGSKQEQDLRDVADEAGDLLQELEGIQEEFRRDVIEPKLGARGLLVPEKTVGWISGLWNTTSELQMATTQSLYKLISEANEKVDRELLEEDEKLVRLKDEYDKLAQSKGWSKSNYFPLIKKSDKNELIDEFQKEFYTTLQKKVQDNDVKWIKNNIDVEKTKALFAEKLAERIKRVEEDNYDAEEKNDRIKKLKEEFSLDKDGDLGWYNYRLLNKFPIREKWESKDFVTLSLPENKEAKALYDYIIAQNAKYTEVGYLTPIQTRVFLPFAPKTLIEAWTRGGDKRIMDRVLRSISINEGDVGYGQYDPLEGRIINSIPRYFTQDPGVEVSTDIFSNLRAYNRMALKYTHLQEIEGLVKELNRIERNKKSLATTTFGNVRRKRGTEEVEEVPNETNAKILDEMTQALLYGKRFIDESDTALGKFGELGAKINKKIGFKLMPENFGSRTFSFNKVLNSLNNTFQLQILGLHPLSAMSNYLGGNFQADIMAGKWYTKKQFEKNLFRIFSNKFIGEDRRKAMLMLKYFEPMPSEYNKQMMRKLSLNKFSGSAVQDYLMALMRKSDEAVSVNIFYSLLDNAIVHEGELLNARRFVLDSAEYKNRYSTLSPEAIKQAESEAEKKIADLIKEKGVWNVSKINDKGELEIPGITKESPGVHKLRAIVKMQVKDALGNISEDEVRRINLLIWGKSFMVFKNWIPRLIDVRIGGLKYNAAQDAYEWGRMRMVAEMLSMDFLKSLGRFTASLLTFRDLSTSKGALDLMSKMYEKKKIDYKRNTNKDLDMTYDEFVDLMRQNIKNQIRDVLFYTVLMSLYFAVKANTPDKDADLYEKNYHKFMVRALDKFSDEVGFFFNPFSLQQILNGSVFPSMGVLTNMAYLVQSAGQELYGITFGDEDVLKKAHLMKRAMKNIPGASSFSNLLPLFDPQLAKDWGIQMSSQSRLK